MMLLDIMCSAGSMKGETPYNISYLISKCLQQYTECPPIRGLRDLFIFEHFGSCLRLMGTQVVRSPRKPFRASLSVEHSRSAEIC